LAATAEEKFAKAQGEAAKESEFQLKLLKAQGAGFEELAKTERKLLTERVNSFKAGTEERKKAEQELQIFEAQVITDRAEAQKQANEKRKAEEEKAAQARFDILNKELQDREARLKSYEDARTAKEAADRAQRISDAQFLADYEADLDAEAFQAVLDDLAKRKAVGDQKIADAQKVADAEAAIRDLNTQNASAAINALGSLFAEGTAASKAAAIADIAIGTATGFIQGLDIAQKTAKAAGPGAALVFPLFYAAQIAAVLAAANQAKQILSTTPGGGSTASVSRPSIPGTPSIGNAGFTGALPGTEGAGPAFGFNLGRQEPVRAYVVAQDVSNGQEAVAAINRRRRLGPG